MSVSGGFRRTLGSREPGAGRGGVAGRRESWFRIRCGLGKARTVVGLQSVPLRVLDVRSVFDVRDLWRGERTWRNENPFAPVAGTSRGVAAAEVGAVTPRAAAVPPQRSVHANGKAGASTFSRTLSNGTVTSSAV